MAKRIYCDSLGKLRILPWGFHLVNDLIPLYQMVDDLKRKQFSPEAKKRLSWMDYYRKCQNVSLTCRHFGITRRMFYYWKSRYNPNNLHTLEDKDKAPKKKRQREITLLQETRIVALRKQYIRYGKEKIAIRYSQLYQEEISSWKIQKVIEKYKLYYNPKKTAKTARKRKRALKKKRITELKKKNKTGFLVCLDVIVIYWNGIKRYIFTAIDRYSKLAFARMYQTRSSLNAEDFLKRLYYLFDGGIDNLQTDNGSEFMGMFQRATEKLNLEHYFNRPRTPKDNPINERFNRTLQEEFINLGNFNSDPEVFNPRLRDWLEEFIFRRPHQALGYKTPIETACGNPQLSQMYSSDTKI
jgi:transposase InsO family protein